MYSIAVCFVVAIVVAVTQSTENISAYTRDNACIGGSLDLLSVPDNLPVNEEKCNVKYKKEDWQQEPFLKYPDAKEDNLYTVIMIDPDAPNHNDGEYYLHWIESNINGKDLADGNLVNGDVISSYVGPGPPKGTGLHKYQFLIYQQEDPKAKVEVNVIPDGGRRKFNLENWLHEQSSTTKLVGPLTGVQFTSDFGDE